MSFRKHRSVKPHATYLYDTAVPHLLMQKTSENKQSRVEKTSDLMVIFVVFTVYDLVAVQNRIIKCGKNSKML